MKKLTVILLILSMVLTLTACGGNEEIVSGETPDNSSISTPPDNANETPVATPQQDIGIGDVIEFGGHEWLVLEVQDGKALILSEKVLTSRRYHLENTAVTWAESDMRQYLNGAFIDDTFTTEEKAKIVETRVENNNNPWFGTEGGIQIIDKVFLLSIEEVVRYFGDSGQLTNGNPDNKYFINDAYDEDRIAYDADGYLSYWWLRSPGGKSNLAAGVGSDGRVRVQGDYVTNFNFGVRPAMWLNP